MTTYDNSAWDGSASQWDTPEAYCRDCLIDLNTGNTKTKDKCKLPYRKPGSSAINKNALRAMASGARGLSAVDAPPAAKRKAANWIISHWQSAFGKPAPASIYKLAGKTPPTSTKGMFYKNINDGSLWFVGIFSNNFQDREDEVITWKAHEEYAQWLKTRGVKPPIVMLHQPQFPDVLHLVHLMAVEQNIISAKEYSDNLMGLYKSTVIAQTEAVIPLNGFMLVFGKVIDGKEDVVAKLMDRVDSWAMSHGFTTLQKDGNIITKYRTFEFSILPEDLAANNITTIGFNRSKPMSSEFKELSPEDRTLIEEIISGSADDVEEATAKAREILARVLVSKSLDTEDVEDEAEKEEEEPVEEEMPQQVQTLVEEVSKALHMDELAQTFTTIGTMFEAMDSKIKALESRIAELTASDDEKVANSFFRAPDWGGALKSRANDTTTDAELLEKLKEQLPEAPVDEKSQNQDNPLVRGFWKVIAS